MTRLIIAIAVIGIGAFIAWSAIDPTAADTLARTLAETLRR